MAAYMKAQEIPPIRRNPKAALLSTYEAKWLRWFGFAVLDPYLARLSGDPALKDQARRTAGAGIMLMRKSPQRDLAYTADKLAEDCGALVKAGLDDPLIYWMQSWAVHASTHDFEAAEKLFQKAYRNKKMAEVRPVLRQLMLVSFRTLTRDTRLSSPYAEKEEEILKAVRLSLEDGTYLPEHEEVLVENVQDIFSGDAMRKQRKSVDEICHLPNLPEWAALMLDARYHDRIGWIARGGGYADTVTNAGWETFGKERELAAVGFEKAFHLHPERGDAAYNLLSMTMTGGQTEKGRFEWLDSALEARFDWRPIYRTVLNGLLPRWGGSIEKLLAFGLSCAATHRFDTDVPYYFFDAVENAALDVDDWHSMFRDPLIAQVAIALCQQRVKDARTPQMKADALALLGSYAWLCGDYATSARALEQVPGDFSRDVAIKLRAYRGWNAALMRGEASIFAAGMGEIWKTAERQQENHEYDAAEKGLNAIRAKVSEAGAQFVASRLATIKFERELAKGEWTRLQVDPSLAGWQIQKGDWQGEPDGTLVNRGRGTSAFIFYKGRVGGEFQIRGEFISDGANLGVLLGYGNDLHSEQWITCLQNRDEAYILHGYTQSSIKAASHRERRQRSEFLITCHDRKITFAINGRNVFYQAEFPDKSQREKAFKFIDEGRVGFCHYLFSKGEVTRIGKMEVRLLPPGFKLDPPPITPPPGDMATVQLFKSDKPWVGKIEVTTGYYKPERKIVLGVVDKADPKKTQAATVTSQPDTQLDSADIYIKKGTWDAESTVFRRTKLTMELGGEFRAKDSLFEECELRKGGNYYVQSYSTKWTFDNCVFSRTFIRPWKLVDIGVKVTNCTFYDVDFSSIRFRYDAGKEAVDEWLTVRNCRFVRCKVPESVALVCRDSVFEACEFGDVEKDLPIKTPLKATIYTLDSPEAPEAGQDRSIETKDARGLGHAVGAPLSHEYKNDRLRFK